MKSIYSISILLFCFIGAVQAQTANWAWAENAQGAGVSGGAYVSTDGNGNVYVAGGSSPFFIAKYTSSGVLVWTQTAWGTGTTNGYGISTDVNKNSYVTGAFNYNLVVFGTDTLINSGSYSNLFIAKYDSNGNMIWAKSTGGTQNAMSFGISSDAHSNAYITGFFTSAFTVFGTDTLTSPHNIGYHIENVFIAKYDSSGNAIWARSAIGYGSASGEGISTDANGNVYITGYFGPPYLYEPSYLVFGSDTLKGIGTGSNIFIAKYDSSGNFIWAKSAGGPGDPMAWGISSDANGNSYLTGQYNDTLSFIGDTLTNANQFDNNIFIAKYDSSGNFVWVKSTSGTGTAQGSGISTDVNDNAYVIGSFTNANMVFGLDTLTNTNVGNSNIFVAKYDRLGNVVWAKSAGGSGWDNGTGICTDANGNVYIAGDFTDTIVCGFDTLTGPYGDGFDFIAKLNQSYPAGIPTIALSDKITIYPNPSTGIFYFSGVQTGTGIEVYNILGEMIYSGQTSAEIYPVSLSSQAKGMYFYKVSNDAGTIQQGKMILE